MMLEKSLLITMFLFLVFTSRANAQVSITANGSNDTCNPILLEVTNPQPGYTYGWFVFENTCDGITQYPMLGPMDFGTSFLAYWTGIFYCRATDLSGNHTISNMISIRILGSGSMSSAMLPRPYPWISTSCQNNVQLCIPTDFYTNFPTTIEWFRDNILITGATAPSYNATVAGWYKYSITSSCMTAFSDSVHITNMMYTPVISGPTVICHNVAITLDAGNGYSGYQWSTGGSGQTLAVNAAGNYTVTVSNGSGCSATASVAIEAGNIPVAVVLANGPTEFCAGGDVLLSASSEPGYTYQWKKYGNIIGGATGSTYLAKRTGKYKAIITDSVGCIRATNAVVVTAYPYPTAQIIALGTTNICQGDSVVMTVNTDPGNTYHWKRYSTLIPGATDPLFTATAEGKYKCIVTNQYGCAKGSNAINVNIVCRVGEQELSNSTNQTLIFPNPSTGDFYIQPPFSESATNIVITDITGKTIYIQNYNNVADKIAIHSLAAGVYMVQIKQGSFYEKIKMVVIN